MATIHCLIGCNVGELTGAAIGPTLGLAPFRQIALEVALAFVSGYLFSLVPLVRGGLGLAAAARLVVAGDTVSILGMETAESIVMLTLPGMMQARPTQGLFWIGMGVAMAAGFVAAYPIHLTLIRRGKGHALTHGHPAGHCH